MFFDFQLLDTQHAMDEDRKKMQRKRGFSKRLIQRRIKDVFKRKLSSLSTPIEPQAQLADKESAWKTANDCIAQASSCGKISAT
jgi:hypothetical protein